MKIIYRPEIDGLRAIAVGADAVIGANSYVNKSVDSNVVAYDSPCKFVRERIKGDPYLS